MLNILEKMGLVQKVNDIPAVENGEHVTPVSAVVDTALEDLTSVIPPSQDQDSTLGGGPKDIPSIYKHYDIEHIPYPVEKFEKLVQGLQSLPLEAQKAALGAMQAVESGWTFASVHGDLLLKRNALHAYCKDLSQLTDEDIKKMEDDLKFREREHLEKQRVIQEKIAALQAEMEQMNQNLQEDVRVTKEQGELKRAQCVQSVQTIQARIQQLDSVETTYLKKDA